MHDFHGTFRDLLHAANLRHGTHGFTSLPKEGVLRIFSPLKIRRMIYISSNNVRHPVTKATEWRKLHNEELNLYSSPIIVRVIKSRRMR